MQKLLLGKLEAFVFELEAELKAKREYILRPGCSKLGDNITDLTEKQCRAAQSCFQGLLPSLRGLLYPEESANSLISFDFANKRIKIPGCDELKATLKDLHRNPQGRAREVISRAAQTLITAIDEVAELESQRREAESQIRTLKAMLHKL